MFMPTSEEARVAESAMLAFCTTLNTPVVNVEALPVGPARAGILVSASEYGVLDLWVRVRLISSDEGLTFKFQGDPTELGDHRAALAAALSFSEGMGFLFEDDMIDGGGVESDKARAHRVWVSLFESEDAAESVPAFDPEPGFVSDDDPHDAVAMDDAPATGAAVMTKFRKAEPAADAPPVERKPGAEEVARIELASEELGGEYVDHAGFLSRVLGGF
ncbi:MAG: hypothetical protein QF570_13105 [Myxococcota bacterium]|jgi:hypothetical protein|nr:hypothetical protein [Myxococcota bacterium]